MDTSVIDRAIAHYGARAVYDAAVQRLYGVHAPLTSMSVFCATLADANETMSRAYRRMSSAEQVHDERTANKALLQLARS